MSQETTRIDSRGFIHNPMLQYHLEDIEAAALHIDIDLTEEEIKKVAIAIFEDNDELALRIGDLILNEAIQTIKYLKNS